MYFLSASGGQTRDESIETNVGLMGSLGKLIRFVESPKDALRSHAQSDVTRLEEVSLTPFSNNPFAFGRNRSSAQQIHYPTQK